MVSFNRVLHFLVEEGLPKAVARTVKMFAEDRSFIVNVSNLTEEAVLKAAEAVHDVTVIFCLNGEDALKMVGARPAEWKVAFCCQKDPNGVAGKATTLEGASAIGLRIEELSCWLGDLLKALSGIGLTSSLISKYTQVAHLEAKPEAPSTMVRTKKNFHQAVVLENRMLTHPSYARPAYCLKLDLSSSGLTYNVGDHLVVYPENPASEVRALAERLGLNLEQGVKVGSCVDPSIRDPIPENEFTVGELLTHFLDIRGKASRRFLAAVAQLATDDAEQKALFLLGTEMTSNSPYSQTSSCVYSYARVFSEFRSIKVGIEELLSLVPSLRPRSYSCASSPDAEQGCVQFSFVKLAYPTASGELFEGLSTSYLSTRYPGSKLFVTINPLPHPMKVEGENLRYVGVALGSGVALLRGVAQHFDYLKKCTGNDSKGKMLLYYGVRHRGKDYVFGDELEKYAQNGVLELYTAFSHDQAEFITPARRISEHPKRLVEYLVDNFDTTTFIYCGPAGPAWECIQDAVIRAIEEVRPDLNGREWIEKMKAAKKWCVQAYTPPTDPENPFSVAQH